MKYADTWDLNTVIPGGTKSLQLKEKLTTIERQIEEWETLVNDWYFSRDRSGQVFKTILQKHETIEKGLEQSGTFIQMWHDAYMDDEYADAAMGQVLDLESKLEKIDTRFRKKITAIPAADWEKLLEDPVLKQVSFTLQEIRDQGKRLLSEAEEKIITELNKDGLTAWSRLYDTIVSVMTIPFTGKDGKTMELSVGQAMNRMYGDPDPEVRKRLFICWEEAWKKLAPVFADTLNHLAGYRITLQKLRKRKDYLEEPLEYNRMSRETLDAMWKAVENNKQPFVDFLKAKAELLGMEKPGWQDVEAPVAAGGHEPLRFTYDEACDFIIAQFSTFGPKLADFAKTALENRWVEAEDRPNKRPGGYCTDLPEFGESRIFMTFTGSANDTSPLAHELGHAFHSWVMRDLPTLNQKYAMNVAETASTFAETIIANATVAKAKSEAEKLSLLNDKISNSVAMFMDIHARFLFETAFYEERTQGIVPEKRLNELMTEAQKKAFCDGLAGYHPHFWCSKLHFFIDDVPFYNFPYTFGYLFSLGLYVEYLKDPDGFEDRYIALLRDTGSMKVEDLAMKHLNVDLTKPDFWEAGIRLAAKDVEEFIALAKRVK